MTEQQSNVKLGPFAFNPDEPEKVIDPEYQAYLDKAEFCLYIGGYYNYDDMTPMEVRAFYEVKEKMLKAQESAQKRKS